MAAAITWFIFKRI